MWDKSIIFELRGGLIQAISAQFNQRSVYLLIIEICHYHPIISGVRRTPTFQQSFRKADNQLIIYNTFFIITNMIFYIQTSLISYYLLQLKYQEMRTNLFLILILAVLSVGSYSQPLKALLYCYLPKANAVDSTQEYSRLADMVNTLLIAQKIDVRVSVCDSKEADKLYDANQISTLFDTYDIVEVDVSFLWAVNIPLLSFAQNEIAYFDKVFPFEWEPTTRDGKIIGSPGLLCSYFSESRLGDQYIQRLYSKFSSSSSLVGLYLDNFVNLQQGRTLDDVDYTKVDSETINAVANFLKDCQDDTSTFNFDKNWCLADTGDFFKTQYSTTTGYSQNLYNFILNGISPDQLAIEHITKTQKKKVFFIDSFVAKDTSDKQKKKTVLSFYEYMLSDEILDIYIQGKYTNKPSTTYLIPPTKHYLTRLVNDDKLYQAIYNTAFKDATQLPLYQPQYAKNKSSLNKLIRKALQELVVVEEF